MIVQRLRNRCRRNELALEHDEHAPDARRWRGVSRREEGAPMRRASGCGRMMTKETRSHRPARGGSARPSAGTASGQRQAMGSMSLLLRRRSCSWRSPASALPCCPIPRPPKGHRPPSAQDTATRHRRRDRPHRALVRRLSRGHRSTNWPRCGWRRRRATLWRSRRRWRRPAQWRPTGSGAHQGAALAAPAKARFAASRHRDQAPSDSAAARRGRCRRDLAWPRRRRSLRTRAPSEAAGMGGPFEPLFAKLPASQADRGSGARAL